MKDRRQKEITLVITRKDSSSCSCVTRAARLSKHWNRHASIADTFSDASVAISSRLARLICAVRSNDTMSTSSCGDRLISVWIDTLLRRARLLPGCARAASSSSTTSFSRDCFTSP